MPARTPDVSLFLRLRRARVHESEPVLNDGEPRRRRRARPDENEVLAVGFDVEVPKVGFRKEGVRHTGLEAIAFGDGHRHQSIALEVEDLAARSAPAWDRAARCRDLPAPFPARSRND